MKKVKFFSGSDGTANELENQINDFCIRHQVVDIQYQSFPVYIPYERAGDVVHGVCQREINSPKVKERFRRKPYGRIGEEFTS